VLFFPSFDCRYFFFFVGMPTVGNYHNIRLLAPFSCQISQHTNPLRFRLFHLRRLPFKIHIHISTLSLAPLCVQLHLPKLCQPPGKLPLAVHHRPTLLRCLRILTTPRIVHRNPANYLTRKRHPPVPAIPPATKILHRQTLTVIHRSYLLYRIHLANPLPTKWTRSRYRSHIPKILHPTFQRPLYHPLTCYPYPYCVLQSVVMLLLCPTQPLKPPSHLSVALVSHYRTPYNLKHLAVEPLTQSHHILRHFLYCTRRHKQLIIRVVYWLKFRIFDKNRKVCP